MQRRRWTPPLEIDLEQSLARYTRWGGDPVNLVEDGTFYRVVTVAGRPLPFSARQLPAGTIEVAVSPGQDAGAALAHMQHRLAASLPWEPLRELARSDRVIAGALAARPGYRPPMTSDLVESLVTSITAQQVNLTWAGTTRRRLVERYGQRRRFPGRLLWQFPATSALAGARHADIRGLQFTNAKAAYIINVAEFAVTGGLAGLETATDEEVVATLTSIKGVGRWTAEWALARCLARPDAVAAGDLGVQKAVGAAYLNRRATEDEVRQITAPWGDAANWATHLLLEGL
ncbi:MAG: hypothetical protein OES13_11160 [Acidimicrobiia bacterium]|nr:hypothetical protein [Acidimicrobiia bacterium]